MNARSKKYFFAILFYVAIGVIGGIIITTSLKLQPNSKAANNRVTTSSTETLPSLSTTQSYFTKVAKEVGPAVVNISTIQSKKVSMRSDYFGSPFQNNDFFDKFFRDFFGGMPEKEYKQMGLGSGLIITEEGYILTNEHVVGEADDITVKLSDGREFKGEIKGTDPRSDLAIIKINATKLPVARLGDSDKVKIGQWAIAIGNPFGFYLKSPEPTITVGVISALHRQLPQPSYRQRLYSDLIQTDAAINPGNSGGPLVNLKGEVIGINVAIVSSTGGYQGVGFAIPINTATFILDKLIKGEEIEYGWLGVSIQDITQDLTELFNLKDKKGALVIKIFPDSPAEKAGMRDDDIITEFNGKQIKNVRELINLVSRSEVDKRVKIKVLRADKEVLLTVRIGKRPGEAVLTSQVTPSKTWKGIEVKDITSDIALRYNISQGEGIVVSNVEKGSSGYWAGIRTGDVIYSINKKQVNSIEDFNNITNQIKKGATVYIRTNRGYITIKSND